MASNDQLALNAYEFCYPLGVVGETAVSGRIEMTTGSGINPDFDPRVRFIGSIIFRDDKNGNAIIGLDQPTFFRTDSGRTEVAIRAESNVAIMQIS